MADRIYEFGPYRLDTSRNKAYQDGEPLELKRKTYELLVLLVERAGELVEKEELLGKMWPDQIVEESNLSQHIYRLRKMLGDNPKSQDYILTVPGKGYIFNQKVRQLAEAEVADRPGGRFTARSGKASTGAGSLPGLLGLLGIALSFGAYLVWGNFSGAAGPKLLRTIPLVALPGEESRPAFSPNGQMLAFSLEGGLGGNQDIYVKMVSRQEMWRVTRNSEKESNAAWSPDGANLAFLRHSGPFTKKSQLIVAPVRGGTEREIASVWGGVAWSPNGRYLAVSDDEGPGTAKGLYLVSEDGRERRNVSTTPEITFDTNLRFSPDGKTIAFVRWKNNINADIFLVDICSRQLRQLTFEDRQIPDIQWSPGGREIYFILNRQGNNRLWRVSVEGGDPVLMALVSVDLESIAISPDSSLLAFSQTAADRVVEVFETDGATAQSRCTIDSPRKDDTPRFSHDGTRIAFVSSRTGSDEIWIANSDCSNPYQLTRLNQTEQVGVGSPRWSPDGRTLVFDRNANGNADIFTIRADGSDLRQLTSDKTTNNMPSWSSDGKWIYFSSYRDSVSRVYRMPAAGGEAIQVTSSIGREPIESADGRMLYYNNGDRLWRKDLISGLESAFPGLEDVTINRYWDVAGSTLVYIPVNSGERLVVRSLDLITHRQSSLFDLPGTLALWVPGIALSPSSRLVAIGYVAYRYGHITLIKDWK